MNVNLLDQKRQKAEGIRVKLTFRLLHNVNKTKDIVNHSWIYLNRSRNIVISIFVFCLKYLGELHLLSLDARVLI